MKPEFILKADLLDILFENRNKEYGAYELRKQYDTRLSKSLGIVLSFIIVVVSVSYWRNNSSPNKNSSPWMIPDSIRLDPVNLHKDPPPPVAQKKIATVRDVTIRIVNTGLTDTTPTTEDKDQKNIGTQNIDGDLPGDAGQKPSEGDGKAAPPTPPVPAPEPEIVDIAEHMPEFPGGLAALQRFLSRNLKTPKDDMEPGSKIRVLARFVVDKEGSIEGIEIEQSGGNDFDNEVIRVMKKMPAWKPGKQNGRNVSVYFKIPVIFQATDEN